MKRFTPILLFTLLSSSCDTAKKIDLNGSWYLDYGSGLMDTTMNYTEFHIKDSMLTVYDEVAGQMSPQGIKVKK